MPANSVGTVQICPTALPPALIFARFLAICKGDFQRKIRVFRHFCPFFFAIFKGDFQRVFGRPKKRGHLTGDFWTSTYPITWRKFGPKVVKFKRTKTPFFNSARRLVRFFFSHCFAKRIFNVFLNAHISHKKLFYRKFYRRFLNHISHKVAQIWPKSRENQCGVRTKTRFFQLSAKTCSKNDENWRKACPTLI